jgi:hypothetical protein
MDTNIKDLIEELKGVVLDLHRSAGNLDQLIQTIEIEEGAPSNKEEYLKMYIRSQGLYREDFKKARGYNELDEKEKIIWKKLISL